MNLIELEELPSEIADPEFSFGDNRSLEKASVEATVPPDITDPPTDLMLPPP